MKIFNKILVGIAALLLVFILVPGCKKYFDPPPYFEEDSDSTKQLQRKMLVIGIDGAAGAEYAKIKPSVLMEMTQHSKYSWEGVSDEVSTDAASWKTLLSGVSFSRHQIKDSTMIYTQDPGGSEHGVIPNYPTFISYLLGSSRSDTRIGAVASWDLLLSKLLPEAEQSVLAADDAAVKTAAVDMVSNSAMDVIFVQFNGVAKAGLQYGFSADKTQYSDAVKKVDGYIGEILNALKGRGEYNKSEEWLVVVQGTHGGTENGYGGGSLEEITVPAFYYNENFKGTELVTEGLFSGVEIQGRDGAAVRAKLLDNTGFYDPKRGEYTLQLKVKGNSSSYPHFLSKMEKWPSMPGYSFFTAGAVWAMSVRSTTSGEIRIQSNSMSAFDGSWHTIGFTIADSADKKWVRRYTDGIRHEDRDITSIYNNNGSVETSFPLTLGWGADPGFGATTYTAADIMIFDKALTDAEMLSNTCLVDITKHPQYDNLIGYWPANDGFGGRFRNRAPGKNIDFILSGPFQWVKMNDRPCTFPGIDQPGKESLMVKSVDLATIFFYWLRIDKKDSWNLEGSDWLSEYEIEFVKI